MLKGKGSQLLLPTLALLVVTSVWGSTFFLIKNLLVEVSALDFLGLRFPIAAAFLSIIFFKRIRVASAQTWRDGLILGVVFAAGQVAQTWGLGHTDASVSGFITGMYVVLTPVVMWLVFGGSTDVPTWIAIFIATGGMAILSLKDLSVGVGESVTLLGALLFAIHIVLLGRWSGRSDPLALTTIQMIFIAVTCFFGALPGGISVPRSVGGWVATMYMVFIAGILVLLLQTWAQSHISASRAAVIMTTEPVFAATFAVIFGGETVTARLLIGGALVLGAMYLAEAYPRGEELAQEQLERLEARPKKSLSPFEPGGSTTL